MQQEPEEIYYFQTDGPNLEDYDIPEWLNVLDENPEIQKERKRYIYPPNDSPEGKIPMVKKNIQTESSIPESSTRKQKFLEACLAIDRRRKTIFTLSVPPNMPKPREFAMAFAWLLLKATRTSIRAALLGLLSLTDLLYSKEDSQDNTAQDIPPPNTGETYLGKGAKNYKKTHSASNTHRLYGECRTTNGHSHNGDYVNVDNHNYKDNSKEYKALIRFFDYYSIISILVLTLLLLLNWLLGGVAILNYLMLSVIISTLSLLYLSWCISKDKFSIVKL